MKTTDRIEIRLKGYSEGWRPEALRAAMLYSLLAGGKLMRPRLLLASCEAAGGKFDDAALDFACAAEMIHTYSLIHDDLPAMDDDDMRRGKPSCHKKFGEAVAILAGDALLNAAFELMADVCFANPEKKYIEAARMISGASGAKGMAAGQALDVIYEGREVNAATLAEIHKLKTGCFISACVASGAVIGGCTDNEKKEYAELGFSIGRMFQIMDDILDVTSDQETIGKPIRSDMKKNKNTYVSVHGLVIAMDEHDRLSSEAHGLLDKLPQKTDALRALVTEIIERKH